MSGSWLYASRGGSGATGDASRRTTNGFGASTHQMLSLGDVVV
ncbi:hypothetical protein ACFQX7_12075 [Luedemannella flava]